MGVNQGHTGKREILWGIRGNKEKMGIWGNIENIGAFFWGNIENIGACLS